MKLNIITPVGPGHEDIVQRCNASVWAEMQRTRIWDDVYHSVVMDDGRGRSACRNMPMDDADWFFFIDADDILLPGALDQVDLTTDATFGAIQVDGKITQENKYPCTWETIRQYGARGTLSMGCFVRNTGLRFDTTLDKGEDFDFYMRLKSFVKLQIPLVNITRFPSAGGPRGYAKIDWVKECDRVISRYAVLESKQPSE